MPDILKNIIDSKWRHIERLLQIYPESKMRRQLSNLSLHSAMKSSGPGYIFECKRASPSRGLLRRQFDIVAITSVYNRYANAISVVTDEDYFQGSFEYLAQVRANTELPVLCKDFIVSAYQVRLAAHLGADAILLMLSVLDDDHYADLADVASYCGLDVLTEVSTEDEVERAIRLGARIIGINNRNLRTMVVDLKTTQRLAPLVPRHCAVISESGISTRSQVLHLSGLVDGFLVGSSLMATPDLDRACACLVQDGCKSVESREMQL